MAYEIYWGAGSPNSWRPLLGLVVKGLDYQSKLLEFSKGEHQTPQMLEMNPRGQLPVLKDGDVSVYESTAILAYLDKKHPEPPLFGKTADQAGHVWQCVFEVENYLRIQVEGIVRPVFFDDVPDNIDAIERSAAYVDAEFKELEQKLKRQDYLAGQTITAADIVLFPFVQALKRAMSMEVANDLDLKFKDMDQHYPAISNWLARIEALPGYSKTYPPNWID